MKSPERSKSGEAKGQIPSDVDILAAFQAAGQQKDRMLTLLLETYQGLFYKAKRRYRLSEEDARDAYTDAFMALSDQVYRGKFRGGSQVSTYFYQIFSNKCADQKRKSQTEGVHLSLETAIEIPQAAMNAFQELVQKEDFERLKKLLAQLDKRCRQLLWESDYLGFSTAELAVRLGLKDAKSVKSQKYRCMEQLRKRWRKLAN